VLKQIGVIIRYTIRRKWSIVLQKFRTLLLLTQTKATLPQCSSYLTFKYARLPVQLFVTSECDRLPLPAHQKWKETPAGQSTAPSASVSLVYDTAKMEYRITNKFMAGGRGCLKVQNLREGKQGWQVLSRMRREETVSF